MDLSSRTPAGADHARCLWLCYEPVTQAKSQSSQSWGYEKETPNIISSAAIFDIKFSLILFLHAFKRPLLFLHLLLNHHFLSLEVGLPPQSLSFFHTGWDARRVPAIKSNKVPNSPIHSSRILYSPRCSPTITSAENQNSYLTRKFQTIFIVLLHHTFSNSQ